VVRVDTQSVYRSLTASVLSTGRPSAATEQVLARAPRLRLAADLYNLGLTLGLSTPDRDHVILEAGRQPLPFGTLTLTIDPEQFVWGGYRMGDFIPVVEFKLRGLRKRYHHTGVGTPLAAGMTLPSLHAFRTIPTCVARMSQMAWDACAIVCLVNV
jgi:hypothetical protein